MPDTAPADAGFDRLRSELPAELELCRLIGEGSVARVFLAKERTLNRFVALKLLRDDVANDEVKRLRFEREAQAAATVHHPNVIAVHRVGRLAGGAPYIVMEHVEGRSLEDLLEGHGRLEVAEVRRILASVAHALAAAHRKGVVHRDLRPANVSIEEETGRVVLGDFGIAAFLESASASMPRLTTVGQRMGDPSHMSPEQFAGEPISGQSDLYALGVMGYELLTGSGPFGKAGSAAAISTMQGIEPPKLEDQRPDVDHALSDVLRRCLARKPDHRPRAAEMAELLVSRAPAEHGTTAVEHHGSGHGGEIHSLVALLGWGEFFGEVQRRKVGRMVIAYPAFGFVFLHAAKLILEGLPVDHQVWYSRVLAVTLIGFPIALAVSWVFDRKGMRPVALDEPKQPASSKGHRLILPLIGLTASIAIAIALWSLFGAPAGAPAH